jgi:chromosome segregation ATPase
MLSGGPAVVAERTTMRDPADPEAATELKNPTSGQSEDWNEYDDLLAGIGAERSEPDSTAQIERRDVTIGELTRILEGLRPLGDLAAKAEQRRQAAAERVAELEERVADLESRFVDREEDREKLELRLSEREAVLERERERHEATRKKFIERKAVAAERWKEMRALRSKLKRLERERSQDGSGESRGDSAGDSPGDSQGDNSAERPSGDR